MPGIRMSCCRIAFFPKVCGRDYMEVLASEIFALNSSMTMFSRELA